MLSNEANAILERLKLQAESGVERAEKRKQLAWYDPGPAIRQKATLEQISEAELKLNFLLPPLLKRIYLEIGNGGWLIGSGIYGVGDFKDSTDCQDAVSISLNMASELSWWRDYLVISDQGCSMYSCIDCSDSQYRVYRLDGNGYPEEPQESPADDFWYLEAESLEAWFSASLKRHWSTLESRVQPNMKPSSKPWWKFW